MKDRRFRWPDYRRLLISLLTVALTAGCTSLEARLSIESYTKNKPVRNALEDLAEAYCREKRADAHTQPDFIFTTDGCSRWPDAAWVACCIAHDIAYWCGGSGRDRDDADRELMRCVNAKANGLGNISYAGVRLGGMPWLPTPWRWGNGWDNWPAGYETLPSSPPVPQLFEKLNVYESIERHLNGSAH